MEPEMSLKNTKNEILSAYEDALKKLQAQKTSEPKQVQEEKRQQEVIKKASDNTNEGIVTGITTLKLNVAKELDKLSEQLSSEYKKLEDIQMAMRLEKQNLEELYQVTANADSLAAMLQAQKERKVQFEIEMTEKRTAFEEKMKADKLNSEEKIRNENDAFETSLKAQKEIWKIEQLKWTDQQKELKEKTEKERKREEEEYAYALKLTRKKDNDLYEEKKASQEKELAEKKKIFDLEIAQREAQVVAAENELKELRTKNAAFPAEIEKAVATAVKLATEKLQSEFRFEKELNAKQTEGELKLKEQTIETLKSKIKDMEALVNEASKKATTAEISVKDIAMKAIESSGKMQLISNPRESSGKE
ncbi:MAG: hypothetical protein K0M40_09245 [Prolixibacteraceae bacterium]|nr:hypothetical protein [Prolixibacteraceae bacterium]